MVATEVLKVRVPLDTKQIVRTLAHQQQLTESALLMRLVQAMLQTSGAIRATTSDPLQAVPRGVRLYVRLRSEDHLLLRERAVSRGMATATYASILLRAHLRGSRYCRSASWWSSSARSPSRTRFGELSGPRDPPRGSAVDR
jgi:hypothetical protein